MTATCVSGSPTASELKVAWVTAVLGIDGKLLYAGPLLEAFSRQFARMRVFTGEFSGDHGALEIERCASVRLYRNERRTQVARTGYGGGLRFATPALIAKLAQYRPDLLVLNEYSIFSLYAILYSKLFRRNARILLIMEAKPRFPERFGVGHARVWFRRLLLKSVDAVLTNNIEGRRYLTDVLGVPDKRIVSEPYLVSDFSQASKIASSPRQHDGKRPVRFLYVGQLIPRKGLQQALEACARLLPQYAGRFVYEIVGDGPQRSQLEAFASELRLGDHIVFHGRQPFDAVPRFYRDADAFLFPTLSDYRSLVPFEALSTGLPILASIHDGGVSETVVEGENGFAIDPYKPDQTAALMARLIEEPCLIADFSRRSMELANRYTLPHAVNVFLKACDLAFAHA
ncbi:MAG TPA: glycosyltransferase [Burkholderiales bacterium]|nr:glycosyltransferase [Burkholderiales bacterium]